MQYITIILLSLFIISGCQPKQEIFQQRLFSFGTLIDLDIAINSSQRKSVELAAQKIEQLLKQRHQQWHAWLPGELSELNQSLQATGKAQASEDMIQLILASKVAYRQSNGLFNPAMGKLIAAWGFHDPKQKNPNLLKILKNNIPTMDDISIHGNTIKTNNRHTQLDFGGIAKGLAIKQIENILQSYQLHDFLINIGGDLFAHGKKFTRAWTAGIQDPFKAGAIGSLQLQSPVSLFTSGNYRRFYINNTKRVHHIISPVTGEPSRFISSATILHPDPILADAAATTLMIAPQSQWQQIAQQMHINDFLIITKNKEIWVSSNMNKKTSFNTSYKIHIMN